MPVIATNTGGNSEVIKNGENGFLVKPGDYRSMGKMIILLATNNDIFKKMQTQAYKTVRENYNINNCIKNFQNFNEQLMLQKYA